MTWLGDGQKPAIIAGPCSAESEEQVYQTIEAIAKNKQVYAIRAGIWKPRTKPNSFEGYGAEALPWLVNAGKSFNLRTCTEVATPEHVEICLKAGIDILWLGARTTVNPFLVQSIADALKGVNIPVMVKNPVNPDLNLWIGSLERIQNAGIKDLAAIHRGFSFYGEHLYRNVPLWEIPIEFQRLKPEVPIICDPSHICGRRDLIEPIAQQALDLNFDGLMIETHIAPADALSDAAQQITPVRLNEVLNKLALRQDNSDHPEFTQQIEAFRLSIDQVDEELLAQMVHRLDIARDIGAYKKEQNVTILKLDRWERMIKARTAQGERLGLDPLFVKAILELIHKESIRIQNQIMNE